LRRGAQGAAKEAAPATSATVWVDQKLLEQRGQESGSMRAPGVARATTGATGIWGDSHTCVLMHM